MRRRLSTLAVLCLTFILLVTVWHLSVRASRIIKDLNSSANGQTSSSSAPAVTCEGNKDTSGETIPFVAALNGLVSNTENCSFTSPSALYPSYVAALTGSNPTNSNPTFTVTVTPYLWEENSSNNTFVDSASSKFTILHLTFTNLSTDSSLFLKSFVIGMALPNPSYLVCGDALPVWAVSASGFNATNNFTSTTTPLCNMTPTIGGGELEANEPTPIALADATTTRWDFNVSAGSSITSPTPTVPVGVPGTTATSSIDLVVSGFPSDFALISGSGANSNGLTQGFFNNGSGTTSMNNFLVTVQDATGATFTAGKLILTPANETVVAGTGNDPGIQPYHSKFIKADRFPGHFKSNAFAKYSKWIAGHKRWRPPGPLPGYLVGYDGGDSLSNGLVFLHCPGRRGVDH